jgi:hypothetical protein
MDLTHFGPKSCQIGTFRAEMRCWIGACRIDSCRHPGRARGSACLHCAIRTLLRRRPRLGALSSSPSRPASVDRAQVGLRNQCCALDRASFDRISISSLSHNGFAARFATCSRPRSSMYAFLRRQHYQPAISPAPFSPRTLISALRPPTSSARRSRVTNM